MAQIRNGARPTLEKHQPKVAFHQRFGALELASIPPFCVDPGLWMPDQVADNAPTECTGYAPADIATTIFKRVMSPDYSYAANLYICGEDPTINGASVTGGIWGLIGFGALPQAIAPISAAVQGELYISDFRNWSREARSYARNNIQNGILSALGNGDPFTSILAACYQGKIPISVGTPMYREWIDVIVGNGKSKTGILPVPQNPQLQAKSASTPWHDWNVVGLEEIDGKEYWKAKMWIPKSNGDQGWTYLPRETANAAIMDVPGTAAVTVDPTEARRIVLIAIMAQRFPQLMLRPQTLLDIFSTL